MIGEKVLGYTIDEKIGEGAFGTVYKVSKTNASGTYIRALKHISLPGARQYADVLNSMGGDYSKADDYFAGVLQELVNEIQIISALSEEGARNIVRYYENDIRVTDSPKRYDIYILMEYLMPFPEYAYANELSVRDVIRLGKDVLVALISCHENGVIHRDIKDDNIFVTAKGTFKLGDFSVSKQLKDGSRAESMKGTPNFIAPEIYLGKGKYDATVDIYSLGIVLYRLLNKNRNPFMPNFPRTFDSDDEDLAFQRRMNGEIPDLPLEADNVLGEIIVRAMKPRDERYDSAKAFLTELEKAETELSEEELEKIVSQVIENPFVRHQSVESKAAATIGSDMPELLLKKDASSKGEANLFQTISGNILDDEAGKLEDGDDIGSVEDQTKPDHKTEKNGYRKAIIPAVLALAALIGFGSIIYFNKGRNQINVQDARNGIIGNDLLIVGDDVNFRYRVENDAGSLLLGKSDDLEWFSSDEQVLTVEDGLVTAVGEGEAVVSLDYCGVEAEKKVKVVAENENVGILKPGSTQLTLKVKEPLSDDASTAIDFTCQGAPEFYSLWCYTTAGICSSVSCHWEGGDGDSDAVLKVTPDYSESSGNISVYITPQDEPFDVLDSVKINITVKE